MKLITLKFFSSRAAYWLLSSLSTTWWQYPGTDSIPNGFWKSREHYDYLLITTRVALLTPIWAFPNGKVFGLLVAIPAFVPMLYFAMKMAKFMMMCLPLNIKQPWQYRLGLGRTGLQCRRRLWPSDNLWTCRSSSLVYGTLCQRVYQYTDLFTLA